MLGDRAVGSKFTVEKPSRHHLAQVMNITNNGTSQNHVPSDKMQR